MSSIETTTEFTGSTGMLIVGILFCFPYAIYYYFDNKEELWVCPSCRESIKKGASKCKHCDEDLDQHT